MPITGEFAYYNEFSDILIINRGVHEPLEEFCFQTLIQCLKLLSPKMLELGSYWGHYSSWLKSSISTAQVYMVEPEEINLLSGKHTFKKNGLEGEFIQNFVGNGAFSVDEFIDIKNFSKLDILHSDIQGYELEMLEGAKNSLTKGAIDYIFISTHSEKLHTDVLNFLENVNYRIEVSADFDRQTTSFDGFIFASQLNKAPVFLNFLPLGREDINKLTPFQLLNYVSQLRLMV